MVPALELGLADIDAHGIVADGIGIGQVTVQARGRLPPDGLVLRILVHLKILILEEEFIILLL